MSRVLSQVNAGLELVTDGHGGDPSWTDRFITCFNGLDSVTITEGRVYQHYPAMTGLLRMTGRISWNPSHPVVREFQELYSASCSIADHGKSGFTVKQNIPAPSYMFARILEGCEWRRFYSSAEDVADAVVEAYVSMSFALYEEGCRMLQFDDWSWSLLCDRSGFDSLIRDGVDVIRYMRLLSDINNRLMDLLPADMVKAIYISRASADSVFHPNGEYGGIAPYVFGGSSADLFYLDMNVDSYNDFAFLRHIPCGRKIMLGLLSPVDMISDPSEFVVKNLCDASVHYSPGKIGVSFRCGVTDLDMFPSEKAQWERISFVNNEIKGILN